MQHGVYNFIIIPALCKSINVIVALLHVIRRLLHLLIVLCLHLLSIISYIFLRKLLVNSQFFRNSQTKIYTPVYR